MAVTLVRRACTLVLLLLAVAAAQEKVEYSNSFENGAFITSPAGSSERGIISSCSKATATVKAASAAVPTRTGNYAAVLGVQAVCNVSNSCFHSAVQAQARS